MVSSFFSFLTSCGLVGCPYCELPIFIYMYMFIYTAYYGSIYPSLMINYRCSLVSDQQQACCYRVLRPRSQSGVRVTTKRFSPHRQGDRNATFSVLVNFAPFSPSFCNLTLTPFSAACVWNSSRRANKTAKKRFFFFSRPKVLMLVLALQSQKYVDAFSFSCHETPYQTLSSAMHLLAGSLLASCLMFRWQLAHG